MKSPFDLTGKVAVVTGSSKGIGKAIAMHLALAGAKVVVSSRKAPACEEAAAEIRAAGGHATVIPCNISDKAQVERLITETRKQLGPVDVMVCNAASNPYYGPNEKLPDDTLAAKDFWGDRLRSIADSEAHLHRNGTRIVKIFLHLSKDEQRDRLIARIDELNRHVQRLSSKTPAAKKAPAARKAAPAKAAAPAARKTAVRKTAARSKA